MLAVAALFDNTVVVVVLVLVVAALKISLPFARPLIITLELMNSSSWNFLAE